MNQSDFENRGMDSARRSASIYTKARAVGPDPWDQHTLLIPESWPSSVSEAQRRWMRNFGRRVWALLLQYNSRADGGEVYLDEGKRITGGIGRFCAKTGFSLPETLQFFLLFRRSILEAIFATSHLGGCEDDEGQRLFQRTNDFFDALMLSLIGSFHENQHVNRKEANECS